MSNSEFPQFIMNLPRADIPFKGVTGWIAQTPETQVVFFDIEPVGRIAPHSHGEQWGTVIEGEMELTIGNETKRYRPGDSYHIPPNVVHSANFLSRVRVIDVFADRDRYKAKTR